MQLIAHRGGSGLRVENTLAAFAHAIELGAAGAELDVHLSRDGEVVVHHDDTLNPAYCRHTGGDWITRNEALPISALTWAQLQRYDIGTPRPGSDYARHFARIEPVADQHIPRLAEVIRLVKARSDTFRLTIEIKASMLKAARQPWRTLVDATLTVVEAEQFGAQVTLCSFDWGSLLYARQQRPDLPAWFTSQPLSYFAEGRPPAIDIPPSRSHLRALRRLHASGDAPWYGGFDPRRFDGSHAAAVAAAGGAAWFPYYRDFMPDTAAELANAGLAGAAWSVNLRDAAELTRLSRAGLDFLATDYPDAAIQS